MKVSMKRLLMILAVIAMVCNAGSAKDKKIKLGKYFYYYGEVANGTPCGTGTLFYKADKTDIALVKGDFEDCLISNGVLVLPEGSARCSGTFEYDIIGSKAPKSMRIVMRSGVIDYRQLKIDVLSSLELTVNGFSQGVEYVSSSGIRARAVFDTPYTQYYGTVKNISFNETPSFNKVDSLIYDNRRFIPVGDKWRLRLNDTDYVDYKMSENKLQPVSQHFTDKVNACTIDSDCPEDEKDIKIGGEQFKSRLYTGKILYNNHNSYEGTFAMAPDSSIMYIDGKYSNGDIWIKGVNDSELKRQEALRRKQEEQRRKQLEEERKRVFDEAQKAEKKVLFNEYNNLGFIDTYRWTDIAPAAALLDGQTIAITVMFAFQDEEHVLMFVYAIVDPSMLSGNQRSRGFIMRQQHLADKLNTRKEAIFEYTVAGDTIKVDNEKFIVDRKNKDVYWSGKKLKSLKGEVFVKAQDKVLAELDKRKAMLLMMAY